MWNARKCPSLLHMLFAYAIVKFSWQTKVQVSLSSARVVYCRFRENHEQANPLFCVFSSVLLWKIGIGKWYVRLKRKEQISSRTDVLCLRISICPEHIATAASHIWGSLLSSLSDELHALDWQRRLLSTPLTRSSRWRLAPLEEPPGLPSCFWAWL